MIDEITAEVEREIIDLIPRYAGLKEAESSIRRSAEAMALQIREYLERTGQESVTDGEHGLTLELQARRNTQWDLMSLTNQRPDLLIWMGEHGLLKVDSAAFRAMEGKAIEAKDAAGFSWHGETQALVVRKEDR